MRRLRTTVLSAMVFLSLVGAVQAQSARSGGGANAQLMQQMQQLASERTSLQAENAKLKKDLEDVRKDRDALKNSQQTLERRVKTSEATLRAGIAQQRETSDRELAQTKDRMQQLVSKFRETAVAMRELETAQTTTKQTLATRDQELKGCVDRNAALYALNQEVLTRLDDQSFWSRSAQREPFTKIKRVQLENMADEYKARADDQRIAPVAKPAVSQPTPH
jgi:chromosome segregation ATPase